MCSIKIKNPFIWECTKDFKGISVGVLYDLEKEYLWRNHCRSLFLNFTDSEAYTKSKESFSFFQVKEYKSQGV